MEKRDLICIGCPLGCPLTVTIENGEITSISNYVKAIADEENEIFFLYQTEIAFQD